MSRDIRITAEVEKIWIIYDIDTNGTLDYEEVKQYIQETAFKSMDLSDDEVQQIYDTIDRDGNGSVDKEEMAKFLNLILILQENSHAKEELKRQEREARKLRKIQEEFEKRTTKLLKKDMLDKSKKSPTKLTEKDNVDYDKHLTKKSANLNQQKSTVSKKKTCKFDWKLGDWKVWFPDLSSNYFST